MIDNVRPPQDSRACVVGEISGERSIGARVWVGADEDAVGAAHVPLTGVEGGEMWRGQNLHLTCSFMQRKRWA